ncbi:MAG: hypothetical protein J0H25_12985 [Rhizobiales bacterium]|nr:hypothetical protein [Hyphomicrobiales bacterium]
MKRIFVWLFYAIGALSVAYLLAYVYIALTAPRITPGDPIEIYRDQDAPSYSMAPATVPV